MALMCECAGLVLCYSHKYYEWLPFTSMCATMMFTKSMINYFDFYCVLVLFLTLVLLNPICPAFTNSADPDQLASSEAN